MVIGIHHFAVMDFFRKSIATYSDGPKAVEFQKQTIANCSIANGGLETARNSLNTELRPYFGVTISHNLW